MSSSARPRQHVLVDTSSPASAVSWLHTTYPARLGAEVLGKADCALRYYNNIFIFPLALCAECSSTKFGHRRTGGKSKEAGSRSMIEYMTCRMWVDLESCNGLTEMSESERNKLVFDCWKYMVDDKVKMADVTTEMEEEIKRLKAEVVSLRRKLEDKRKLKGGEYARCKRKVDGDVNHGAKRVSERDEQSRVNEKINGFGSLVLRI
ncbi:hypothetical protein FHG87_002486 [Trinorchestia longiramus]|nr:hypothetical protein FHG87_002486 [Trinorchestia longiramus]